MVKLVIYCDCGAECKTIKSGDIYKTAECPKCGKVFNASVTDITKFKFWKVEK